MAPRNALAERMDSDLDAVTLAANAPDDGAGYPEQQEPSEVAQGEAPADLAAEIAQVLELSGIDGLRELLSEAQAREGKSLKKYMGYLAKHGDKLRALESDYTLARARTAALFSAATNGLART